jgi:hypothetical protein
MQAYSEFTYYWRQLEGDQIPFSARPLTPLIFKRSQAESLRFRLVSEPYVQDRRFRVIYYLPADPFTIRQCADWFD